MSKEPLDLIPLWLLFFCSCGLGWLAMEVGYRFGAWRHVHTAEEKESPVGAMVGSILGLLAFLLAFTFSLAAARFDLRREAVLDEANAIGTTFLRTRLLPEPHRTKSAELLREYVDVRLRGVTPAEVPKTVARSEAIHELIWSEAVKAAEQDPRSVPTGLFIQSLNEVIDLHEKRVVVGMRNRIPPSIWGGLFALALLGMAAVGYQAGLSATRRSPAMVVTVVAFAGVLFLIADLDRGHEGFLTVSQQAMLDVQRSMQDKTR